MRDPWQDDALDELVAYLGAARDARAPAWALVMTSSDAVANEALQALEARVGELELVDLSKDEEPRRVVDAVFAKERADGFRMNVVQGLSDILASDRRDEFLAWLNFHREDFERAGEAFLFVLPARHASTWQALAPDLDAYTQHFDFVDWSDLVADARRDAGKIEVEIFSLGEALRRAERRLEHARHDVDQEIKALVEVGLLALEASLLDRAREAIEDALSRARAVEVSAELVSTKRPMGSVRTARQANAILMSSLGHPKEALLELEILEQAGGDESLHRNVTINRFLAGHPRRALAELEEILRADIGDRLWLRQNIGVVGEWLGEVRRGLQCARDAPADLQPWNIGPHAGLWVTLASLLIDTGDLVEALGPLTRSLWLADAAGFERARVAGLANLARATLETGHPAEGLALLEHPEAFSGWKTADGHDIATVRAEARHTLAGPAAVLPVIRDERERQRGWKAPIPAAELAYVRAIASVGDDEERRYLQEASDRFRAMDGWYYLSELERRLARLDRLAGDLDGAAARAREGLEWHTREGVRPREARDRTELAMIALGRGDAGEAIESANRALELIRACGTRLYEPAALVALAAAERILGHHEIADAHDHRWRRLVRGIGAKGLEAVLERDAAWARDVTAR